MVDGFDDCDLLDYVESEVRLQALTACDRALCNRLQF
jgi:hypothetical protein